jgi:hypothetical protein
MVSPSFVLVPDGGASDSEESTRGFMCHTQSTGSISGETALPSNKSDNSRETPSTENTRAESSPNQKRRSSNVERKMRVRAAAASPCNCSGGNQPAVKKSGRALPGFAALKASYPEGSMRSSREAIVDSGLSQQAVRQDAVPILVFPQERGNSRLLSLAHGDALVN